MKDITLKGESLQEIIEKAIPKLVVDVFTQSYSNPLKDAIEEELKANDSIIKGFVKDLLVGILHKDSFKEKITEEIVLLILKKGLKQ